MPQDPQSPVEFREVAAALWIAIGAATAASYLPARRAAQAEPIVSLRTP